MFKLLTKSNNKAIKGEARRYMTFVLHLAPADRSGKNVCAKASPGCRLACLNKAGRGQMNSVQTARIRKTVAFFTDRAQFIADLKDDIRRAAMYAYKRGFIPAFRLNGTSDIPWEKYGVIQSFPTLQFYDYTKILGRKVAELANYHLTFSRAENNDRDVQRALAAGMNVAVVYDTIPAGVYSADEDDLRFLDPPVGIVGLKAKGRAKKDTTGFVVRTVDKLAA